MAKSFGQMVEQSARIQKILWGAFTFSILLYGGIGFVVSHEGTAVLPFAAAALVLNVFAYPNPPALAERGRRLIGPEA